MGPEPELRLANLGDADELSIVEHVQIPLPDGTSIGGASMTKPID